VMMSTVDTDAIRAFGFKVVLDYAYGSASFVMPNVLAKLGAEVLTVNPYASTSGATAFDRDAHARRVADLVRASGAHLGAVIHPDGERITLIDDAGQVLVDDTALLVLLELVLQTTDKARVALPVAVGRGAEDLCQRAGAEIVWTKLSASHLMEVASSSEVHFAASQDGGYVFPAFLPAYDGVAALVNLLSMLGSTGVRLSKVVGESPRVHIAHQTVATPWEQKGMVMRTMVERLKDSELVLIDGVKVVLDDGWALVLPDPEEPLTHVWAEGGTAGEARSRAQDYARRIRQLLP
jgi:mannose-1-phosphate guanylyltransferase/phosphomannomutase